VTGSERVRVVVAGPVPDDPDRRLEVVARALRDAGMEVVYTAGHQTPEQLAAIVVQEDADAVVLPVAPEGAVPLLTELLRERDAGDVAVLPADATGPQTVDRVRLAVGVDRVDG
jgi:methylmalonyl-CoA mutase C-terminal domain/subunit